LLRSYRQQPAQDGVKGWTMRKRGGYYFSKEAGLSDNEERNTTINRGAKRDRAKATRMVIAASEPVETSMMMTHRAEGRTEEENGARCLAAAAVVVSP
jgi:hypothetical protein